MSGMAPRGGTLQVAIGAVIIAVALLVAFFSAPLRLVDDAWISYRYADNLAFRGELTFNPGERTEGISNLLWTLLLAALHRIVPAPIVWLAAATGFTFLLLMLYRLWVLGREVGLDSLLAALAPAVIILTPAVRETMFNGLEAPLFGFLLAEALLRIRRDQQAAAAACLGALFLTRWEAFALGAAFLGMLASPSMQSRDGLSLSLRVFDFATRERRSKALRASGAFLLLVTLGSAFRLLYFGAWLPNSVQAKIYPINRTLLAAGWEYVQEFFRGNLHLAAILLISLGLLIFQSTRRQTDRNGQTLLPSLIFCLLAIGFSIAVALRAGGDWMGGFRLLSQYAPAYGALLLIVFAELVTARSNLEPDSSPQRASRVSGAFVAGLTLLLAGLPLVRTFDIMAARLRDGEPLLAFYSTPGFPFWDDTAERLENAPLEPTDTVSSEGIGYLSYVLRDSYMHDPLGLTEEHIAKEGKERSPFGKSDIRYTFRDVQPAVMIWHYAGNLRGLEPSAVDAAYDTFCHGQCETWSADVVMIRKDRAALLGPYFADWQRLTFTELQATAP